MGSIDKYETDVKKAPLSILKSAFVKLTDAEVDLESKLKDIQDAKARIFIEIDRRVNNKNNNNEY
jgi:hypothetical protein